MSLRMLLNIPVLAFLAFPAYVQGGVPITIEQTRIGCLFSDDFNDGVMDTASNLLALIPWQPLYADSNLNFREFDGYFHVYGNTGSTALGQHRGIQTNPYTYNNWEIASLESLELVSLVEMWNLDPVTPAVDDQGQPTVARMANHYCCNCYTAAADFNATVSIGYMMGLATGPGWDPPGAKWGYRAKWNVWANRYLSATDSIFGTEQDNLIPTMIDNYGFDPLDSTLATGYVYHDGNWITLGSRKLEMRTCRKTELKSMCQFARNHQIDYRWDNYRLFPNSKRWPVRFTLTDTDTVPLLGDYVLDALRLDTGALVDRDTLDTASEFAIYLDHTELVIPQGLKLILYADFTDSVGTSDLLADGEVQGCYPDDAYIMYLDTTSIATSLASPAGAGVGRVMLAGNYPNPWNPQTRFGYTIPEELGPIPVTLRIYDVSGRLVRTLVDGEQGGGAHEVFWDGKDLSGSDVASGVYLYRLVANGTSQTRRMILLR